MAGIFDSVINAMNSIFGPILAHDPTPNNPILTIFIISFIVSLITTIANKYLVDQKELAKNQKEMKEFQKKFKEVQQSGNEKEIKKMKDKQVEMMQKNSKMMTQQFKPMIATMVPILLVFYWMRFSAVSKAVVILPPIVYYCTLVPVFHFIGPLIPGYGAVNPHAPAWSIGWLMWYMICTFGMSQILRKFMGFEQGF
jgi:uncharacterized membrane protein (DUF106 family)